MSATAALAQRGTGDWMTTAYDPQRSSWVRSDGKISPETMSKPGFEMVWKVKLNNAARQLNNTTPPALLDFYIGYRGFRTLGFFGGSSDRVIGIDVDIARIEWEKSLGTPSAKAGTIPCPGGMTSAVTRPTIPNYPTAFAGRGGRGTPAKSGVGLPHEGAVTLRNVAPPPPRAAPAAKPATPAPAADSPFAPRIQWVMSVTGDGKLHAVYVSNGHEPNPPIPFLPADAHAQGLIVFDNTAYVSTVNGCGGADNGVWALDLTSKKVSQWKTSANVAGNAGPAFGPDGVVYVAAGSELAALASKTLAPMVSARISGTEFSSSPVVFEHKGKNLIAATTTDGRVHVFDSAALDRGPIASSAVYSAAGYATGSVSSWEDGSGTRWILLPSAGSVASTAGFRAANGPIRNGAVVAWKLVEKGGAMTIEPGWVSRDMISPHPPVIVNGVIFALSSGEFRGNDGNLTAAQRAQRSSSAVLYALDAATGKEVWSSGNTMTSFVHSGGMSAGGGRVYVATHDGTQYAFGFPMEH
jgi:outer membrane protein assembly factor BamB